jgi:hypothetical protein
MKRREFILALGGRSAAAIRRSGMAAKKSLDALPA